MIREFVVCYFKSVRKHHFLFSTIYLYEGTNYSIPVSNLNNKNYNTYKT